MNILLTSAGRRSYLVNYFKEALNKDGKVHASNSEWSNALEVADEAVITPLIYGNGYIEFILEYCKNNDINAVISLFDIDLPVLANSKKVFQENGIELIVSDYDIVEICNDKWRTYNFLKEYNFKVPKTYISLEDCLTSLNNGDLTFPLIIKPRWGMGSIGIYKALNQSELVVFFKKTKEEIQNSYLKYESGFFEESVIIQEFISGQEYGLDIINDLNGNYVTTLVKKKIAMRAGETDSAISVQNDVLTKLGKEIAIKLRHIANLDMDCFMVNNQPYILEMNCRFGGGYPFSHIAGVNLPLAILKWLNNEDGNIELKSFNYGVEGRKDIVIIPIQNK